MTIQNDSILFQILHTHLKGDLYDNLIGYTATTSIFAVDNDNISFHSKVFKAEYMFSDWILDCQSDEECKSNITALR